MRRQPAGASSLVSRVPVWSTRPKVVRNFRSGEAYSKWRSCRQTEGHEHRQNVQQDADKVLIKR